MDASAIIEALETTRIAVAIRSSLVLFPLIEALHVLGLTLVVGSIAILDLRLLGLASTRRPFTAVASDVLMWTWMAFGVTVVTGALMFATNASTYFPNAFFRVKMALLAVAGLNMLAFERTAGRSVETWNTTASAPRAGRVAAAVSLVLWLAIIVLGRWVGFTSAQAVTPADSGIDLDALEDLIPK